MIVGCAVRTVSVPSGYLMAGTGGALLLPTVIETSWVLRLRSSSSAVTRN